MVAENDADSAGTPKFRPVRRHRRYLFSVPLRFHHMSQEHKITTHGISLEISEGGMSAVVEGELRIGEIAKVDVPLSDGALNALAIVRHKTAGHYGFEFLGLNLQERQQLQEHTKLLLPHRGTLLANLGM